MKTAFGIYLSLAENTGQASSKEPWSVFGELDDKTDENALLFDIRFNLAKGSDEPFRNFVLTEWGRIGWVPKHCCRPGDPICVFRGAAVPHVLRRDGLDSFKLLGECYMHGLMRGEAANFEDCVSGR